ncbi:MAG: CoA transferase [Chloroflexi bacterium]|nr:CoA transferase [Chloroflexota bacterium]
MAGPLEGVRVIEFTEIIAGPVGGMLLADFGADVIKVEPPWGDPWRGSPGPSGPNESRGFISVNRGKRSIRVDLTKPAGKLVVHRLVADADVVVLNHRPDVPAKLGIDYETLSAVNPRLIYCEVTAYGRRGPNQDLPGYDVIVQALSGMMTSEGHVEDGVPRAVSVSPVSDMATGYSIMMSVSAALYYRERTGKGQKIENSLLQNSLTMQGSALTQLDDFPTPGQIWRDEDLPVLKEAGVEFQEIYAAYRGLRYNPEFRAYYRAYQTSDWVISIGCLSSPLRKKMADAMGVHDIRFDPGYVRESAESVEFAENLIKTYEKLFSEKTTAEWMSLLTAAGVPCGPMRFIEEMVYDEQALANGMVVETRHSVSGNTRGPGPLSVMSESPLEITRGAPAFGEHTREVLLEAGYTEAEIEKLVEAAAVF